MDSSPHSSYYANKCNKKKYLRNENCRLRQRTTAKINLLFERNRLITAFKDNAEKPKARYVAHSSTRSLRRIDLSRFSIRRIFSREANFFDGEKVETVRTRELNTGEESRIELHSAM